jgi:hypothetical protein
MGFWRPFAKFEPLTEQVPYWPYSKLSSVAWRARNILRGRSSDQIRQIVEIAGDMIDSYFEQAKEEEFARLKREEQYDFLDCDEDGNCIGIRRDRIDELDFPTPDNTDELDALTESIGSWSDVFGDDTPDPEEYEYFAAVALMLVADAVYALNYSYNFQTREDIKREKQQIGADEYRRAGEIAIQAMEAIGYAETGKKEERLKEWFEKRLDDTKKKVSAEVEKVHAKKWKEQQALETKQKSDHARKMAMCSLRNRDASRAAVLQRWDGDPSLQGISNAKAGVRLSDWLATQDLEFFEPRTVAEWLSDHKRQKTSP